MKLRKLNGIFTILIILIFIIHAFFSLLSMIGLIKYGVIFNKLGIILLFVCAIHIIISVYLSFKERIAKTETFPPAKVLLIQMISGIVFILFTIIHVYTNIFFFSGTHSIIPVILIALVMISLSIHLSTSIPHLLFSLGCLPNMKSFIKVAKSTTIIMIICTIVVVLIECFYYVW